MREKIDVMVWEAGSTDTQFVKDMPSKSIFMTTSEVAAAGCLKDLGKERFTAGTFKHDLQAVGVGFFPLGLLGGNIADKQREEYLKKNDRRKAD